MPHLDRHKPHSEKGPTVLVLGGGFAGLSAVRRLSHHRRRGRPFGVRLIDRLPYNVFYPLLPDLISETLAPEDICRDLQSFCRKYGAQFTQADVTDIRLEDRSVETSAGTFAWDYLLICLGCETNYFGNDDFAKHTFSFKSIPESRRLVADIMQRIEEERHGGSEEQRAEIIVVGGGYTGFEVAGRIAELIHGRTGLPYGHINKLARIRILNISDTILAHSPRKVRDWTIGLVKKCGIEVFTRMTVDSFPGHDTVKLSNGEQCRGAVVVWAPGVAPGSACATLPTSKERGGRLAVDAFLRLPSEQRIFCAGDLAAPIPPGHSSPLYMGVQFSLSGGKCAAENILRTLDNRPLRPFAPADLGHVVPLAPGAAAGAVLGVQMQGRIPYLLHYAMCIYRSLGWKNRLAVFNRLFLRTRARS